jgi:hypothetical protein
VEKLLDQIAAYRIRETISITLMWIRELTDISFITSMKLIINHLGFDHNQLIANVPNLSLIQIKTRRDKFTLINDNRSTNQKVNANIKTNKKDNRKNM